MDTSALMKSADTELTEVFISVGRCCTDEQKSMVKRIFEYVRKMGLRPLSSNNGDDWPSKGPVEALKEVMDRASGTIVVAFERKVIERGRELRTSAINDELITTVWNQIEAGMACAANHPILVLMDHSIRQEGLLDRNFPWHVEYTDLTTFDPNFEAFSHKFVNFCEQMKSFRESRDTVSHLKRGNRETVAEIFGSYSPEQLKLLSGALVGLLAMVASAAYFIGRYFAK
jgi:hypothetical protein